MFFNGVGEYIDYMEEFMLGMKDGFVWIVLDIGCGVSFYVYKFGVEL